MAMTLDEFRKVIVKATDEFCDGMPYRLGAPLRIQFPLTCGAYDRNIMLQLTIGCAEDIEGERKTKSPALR